MGSKERSFFKSSDARGFLFFLFLTSVVAIFIKLSKDYTKTYSVPIGIRQVPIDKTIKNILPKKLEFNAELNGFSLLLNSFRSPEIEIDFNSLDSIAGSKLSYDTRKLNAALGKAITGAKEFSSFNTPSIAVAVDLLSTKKVPVLVDLDLDYKSGYDAYDRAAIIPDSVTAVGPMGLLEQLKGVKTKSQSVENISNDVVLSLEIDTLALYNKLRLSDTNFAYKQKVAKYTEGSFSIPVTVIGAQKDLIKIFPREVVLFYVASLEEYDSILASDFEVGANFETRNNEEEFIVLTIDRKPDNVRNVRLETKQIKFIVVN